ADGNLWLQERLSEAGDFAPVFDLVNRKGELFDRVQIPGATRIVGFAPGVVFLSSRTGAGESLVRARIH
ncbi:MAG TPA: hypothetical protein VMH39_09560, partial [Gemmatimonadaceae bacterium]|nr:hypothetical protein [Gemmatimonadaceae bacterium]